MVWKVSFFLTICLSLGHTLRPKGVRPDFASFYDPNSAFHCLDGSAEIPFDQVNDDYCDCKVRIIRQITQIIVIYCDFTRIFSTKVWNFSNYKRKQKLRNLKICKFWKAKEQKSMNYEKLKQRCKITPKIKITLKM